jgi:predicted adenine nucleotide alpha hydrolase (AANH) superfamily ATPase
VNILLHCCCGPCSVECAAILRAEGTEPHLFWYNPNIHLYTEYACRRDSLALFAAKENLALETCDEYGLRLFLNTVGPETINNEDKKRCAKCYRLRLEKTASVAAQKGYKAFTTTLLISPYQDHEEIKKAGEEAAAKNGLDFLYRDFRPRFREGQNTARKMGLYMQKYCGCVFSEEEKYSQESSHGGTKARRE